MTIEPKAELDAGKSQLIQTQVEELEELVESAISKATTKPIRICNNGIDGSALQIVLEKCRELGWSAEQIHDEVQKADYIVLQDPQIL